MEKEIAYVAWTNTDLTEGRGANYPLAICRLEATAIRLGKKGSVQGANCIVTKCDIFRHENNWYGPIRLVYPDKADETEQKIIDARESARQKALAAGLTDEEVDALSS